MGPMLLGALSLAAYGCSSNDNTGGTKSTSCSANPSGCKAGTTCWVGTNGSYACLPAKAGAGQGAKCTNVIGQPQCDHGLACFQGATGSASGICMPFCDQGGCSAGEICTQSNLKNPPNTGSILVCGPGPTTDGGSNDTGGTTANTINAASCSYADVQAAVDSAVVGDIVTVPAGTCSWTSALHITKGVILKGAGIDTTTIINEIVNARAGDFLVIIKPAVIADNPHVEVTGFTLNANSEGGAVSVRCRDKTHAYSNFRIHHNKIENTLDDGDSYMSIRTKGDCFGLIDDNQFINNEYDFKIYGDDQNSWDDYPGITNVGSANYLYIENNTSIGSKSIILASGEGARWVYRYNTVDNSTNGSALWDAHGDTRNNGVVGFELYDNIVTAAKGSAARRGFKTLDYRGGTGIIYNNSVQAGTSGTRTFINVREEHNDGHCTEPVSNGYIWNNRNTLDNKILAVWESDPYNCIAENTDWWDDAAHSPGGESPSNFIYNIAASRPTTCSDDDCYWETDTKKLYRCEGANNWVFIYKPYTYPHPLRGGQGT